MTTVEQLALRSHFTESEAKDWLTSVNFELAEVGKLIVRGYEGRVWIPLGYHSWSALCEHEFKIPQLSRAQRREFVGALRAEGLSTRAIGAAVGASKSQVDRDLESGVPNGTPADVVGLDGKSYEPTKPKPALTEEEWLAVEHDRAIDRNVERLHKFISGWFTFSRLADHPDRDEILARLVESDRNQITAIAEELQWRI